MKSPVKRIRSEVDLQITIKVVWLSPGEEVFVHLTRTPAGTVPVSVRVLPDGTPEIRCNEPLQIQPFPEEESP